AREPPVFAGTPLPAAASTAAPGPKGGTPAEPGLVASTPGIVEIMGPAVSVCHQVSTTGQRSPPITRRYHIHASGLMGSPPVPMRRNVVRSCRAGYSAPSLTNVRIAVGAV